MCEPAPLEQGDVRSEKVISPTRDNSSRDRPLSESSLSYPEGGLEGWCVVFGSFCVMLSVFGVINTAAVFESYFKENQLKRYNSSEIGWIFSLYLFVVYFVGMFVGPIFDKYGSRMVVAFGSILMVAGPLLLSLCSEYYQIMLTFAIIPGLGGALLNSPSYAAIGHYFLVRRGLATGIASTAGSVGGIIFPLLLRASLPRFGFAWSMRILGFILLFLAVPSNILIRTRLPRGRRHTSVWPDVRIFYDLKFALCCSGIFFMEYGVLLPLTYVVSYAISHGQDANASYILPALLNAGSVLGRAIPGLISDRVGRFNVIIVTVGMCTATVLGMWLTAGNSGPMLLAFTTLLGFASGGNVSLIPVCIGQLCDSREYGRFLSTAMLAASFGTLTGIPIGGALLRIGSDATGWTALILCSGISYAISLSCYATVRILAVGWKLTAVY